MAYTFEQSYYFRPYRGNSSFWLNRYGNGSIASHQKATLYTAAGSADQRLKVHKVSGGCQLLSDLNNAYGLNIYGTKAGSVCDFYPVSGNFNDALIDLLTVDAANNLYRIKMINHNLYLTPASNSSGAALTWENASNADNQIWQLCASQSSGGGSTGGSTTITMPVNATRIIPEIVLGLSIMAVRFAVVWTWHRGRKIRVTPFLILRTTMMRPMATTGLVRITSLAAMPFLWQA